MNNTGERAAAATGKPSSVKRWSSPSSRATGVTGLSRLQPRTTLTSSRWHVRSIHLLYVSLSLYNVMAKSPTWVIGYRHLATCAGKTCSFFLLYWADDSFCQVAENRSKVLYLITTFWSQVFQELFVQAKSRIALSPAVRKRRQSLPARTLIPTLSATSSSPQASHHHTPQLGHHLSLHGSNAAAAAAAAAATAAAVSNSIKSNSISNSNSPTGASSFAKRNSCTVS